jgi:hypothetical protein
VTALVVGLALAIPATALAGPAVDEYTLDLPDAKGKVESPESSPVANPAGLPPQVVSQLRHSSSGKALATIATAASLGAPIEYKGGSPAVAGGEPSTLSAVGSAVGDPAVIGLIVVLLAVGGGMFLAKRKWSA